MSTKEGISNNESGVVKFARVDMKLEAVVIPVSDVDRAKAFYGNLAWNDDDFFYILPMIVPLPGKTGRGRRL